jgi:hypothetical protein
MPRRHFNFNTDIQKSDWRAGNPARSRLSGGRGSACTRPQECLSRQDQSGLHRILFNIEPNSIELLIGTNQAVEALLLPKWPACTEQTVGFMSGKSLQRAQPLIGRYMRSCQKMNMIRHHNECMQLITVQCALAMPQGTHHHSCNLWPSKKQRTIRAFIQKSINYNERLSRRHQSLRREYSMSWKTAVQTECDKHRSIDNIPMGQPTFIMPHTLWWCWDRAEILSEASRLKAGCGQDCPPSNEIH